MTIHLGGALGVMFTIVCAVILNRLGVTIDGVAGYAALFGLFVVGLTLHYVSPIPQDNGGIAGRPPKKQQWGFTTEPQEDNR